MSTRFQDLLDAVQGALSRRTSPQTPDDIFNLTADALRRAFGEIRCLFYLSLSTAEVDPQSLMPCPARRLMPGVYVYDSLNKTHQFTFKTSFPYCTPLVSSHRHYGLLLIEIMKSPPPDVMEQSFIGWVLAYSAYGLEEFYQTNGSQVDISKQIHQVSLDPANRQVWANQTPITLKGRELAMLQLLYDHRNQICGREDICQSVYAAEVVPYEGQDHRLNQLIYRLKTKLAKIENNPIRIESVYKKGYRLRLI